MQSGSATASQYLAQNAANSDPSTSEDSRNMTPILIALLVINGLFATALLFLAYLLIRGRPRNSVFDSHRYATPGAGATSGYVSYVRLLFLYNADVSFRVQGYEAEQDGSTYYDPYQFKASADIKK
jgi:hypothetical protein